MSQVAQRNRKRTILMCCDRCGAKAPSQPLPPRPALQLYGLPTGWELVPNPNMKAEDWLRCRTCKQDVERGSPMWLGGPPADRLVSA